METLWDVLMWAGIVVGVALVGWYSTKCFAFVRESTGRAVMRAGAYMKMLFAKKGWELDKECNLVGDGNLKKAWWQHLFGGLRFVGFWPFDRIFTYNWDWNKSLPDGTLKAKHEDDVSSILVGQDYVYGMEIKGDDVVDAELVPIETSWALTAQICNPKKALFDVDAWFSAFLARVRPYIRDYINAHKFADIISDNDKHIDRDVLALLVERGIVQELRDRYGIDLRAVECKGIRPAGKYQDAQTEKWQAQRDVERDRAKRLGSTVVVMFDMIAEATKRQGQTSEARREEVQAEFNASPARALRRYAGLIEMNRTFIDEQIGADAGALRHYYFHGASGGLDIVALLGDVLRSGQVAKSSKDPGNPNPSPGADPDENPPKPFSQMTEEEKQAWAERRAGRRRGSGGN